MQRYQSKECKMETMGKINKVREDGIKVKSK